MDVFRRLKVASSHFTGPCSISGPLGLWVADDDFAIPSLSVSRRLVVPSGVGGLDRLATDLSLGQALDLPAIVAVVLQMPLTVPLWNTEALPLVAERRAARVGAIAVGRVDQPEGEREVSSA